MYIILVMSFFYSLQGHTAEGHKILGEYSVLEVKKLYCFYLKLSIVYI